MEPHRETLVIWDFDGTIADTSGAIVGSATAALSSIGIRAEPGVLRRTIGLPLTEMFRIVTDGADDQLIGRLEKAYRADFAATAPSRSRAFPGIRVLVEDLAAREVRQALATSRRRHSLDPLLDVLDLVDRFGPVMTDDDVVRSKLDPEMLIETCRRAGVDPGDAWMVGDTTFDMEMGRMAGTVTVAVTWGNHERDALTSSGADHTVDSVEELAAVLPASQ